VVSFFVPGRPKPKGSTHSFNHPVTGAVITKQQGAKVLPVWQARIAHEAKMSGAVVAEGPVSVCAWFSFTRPKSHSNRHGLRADAPLRPTSRAVGDVDKLARALLDALTGVVWHDDSQCCSLRVSKHYCKPGAADGVAVEIREIKE